MEILGVLEDGVGQAKSFTLLDWVREQFRNNVGFDPCPGTFNVRVLNPVALAIWRARPGIAIEPADGYCAARCYPVQVSGRVHAAWIIPAVPGYPDNLVELMAPVSLRKELNLNAGDLVQIRLLE